MVKFSISESCSDQNFFGGTFMHNFGTKTLAPKLAKHNRCLIEIQSEGRTFGSFSSQISSDQQQFAYLADLELEAPVYWSR